VTGFVLIGKEFKTEDRRGAEKEKKKKEYEEKKQRKAVLKIPIRKILTMRTRWLQNQC
jgi:hypothetical protein